MVQMGALVGRNSKGQIPGDYNYLQPSKVREKQSFQLIQVEEAESRALFPLVRIDELDNNNLPRIRSLKTDLPLTSDFGGIKTPYDLIFANLEGLQYYNRN